MFAGKTAAISILLSCLPLAFNILAASMARHKPLIGVSLVVCMLTITVSCNCGGPFSSATSVSTESTLGSVAPPITPSESTTPTTDAVIPTTTNPPATDPSPDSNLTYYIFGDSVVITGYKDRLEAKEIVIPEKIDGKSVISIDNRAFSGCWNLVSIIIPNSVISIGNQTFHDCVRLTSITMSDSIISIGDEAFYNCTSLTRITIPDSVIGIGSDAFFCGGLHIDIPTPTGWTSYTFHCSDLTITCSRDSYVHQYCMENHITFQLTN